LLGPLQEAEADHDRARLGLFAGVTREALEAERTRWSRIGGAIVALARLVPAIAIV